jgi:hypothetical protein
MAYAGLKFSAYIYTLARRREVKGVYRIMVHKSEGKRKIWRNRSRLEDNMKTRFKLLGLW